MGLVIATLLAMIINRQENNKILGLFLVAHIALNNIITYYGLTTVGDYIKFITWLDLILMLILITLTDRKLLTVLFSVVIIVPQTYYLIVLYKPYLFLEEIPMWWWLNVNTIFLYGVFGVLYEQALELDFKKMQFKNYMINLGILVSLIVF